MPVTKPAAVSNSNVTVSDADAARDHSSKAIPAEHMVEADHAQFDDDEADIVPVVDPNISGHTPTEAMYTWLAGPLNAFQENDDYREFFEPTIAPESRLLCGYHQHDGDYDDNGGVPLAIGESRGHFRPREKAGSGDRERDEIAGSWSTPISSRRI